jgi:hypothetical protein
MFLSRVSTVELRENQNGKFQMLQANICRIAVQPVVRRAAAAANGPNGGAGATVPATLSLTHVHCICYGTSMSTVLVDAKQQDVFQERKEGESSTRHIIEERSFGIA